MINIPLALQQINFAAFVSLMQAVSWLGNEPQIFLLITAFVLALLFLNLRREAFFLAVNGIGVYILGTLIKLIVQRPRPPSSLLHDWSFPSGHVLSFVACFGFLAYLAYTFLPRSLRRTILLSFLVGLIILVGVSRIYLGDHWASDVFGSYLLGVVWLLFMIGFYNQRHDKIGK